MLDGFTKFFLKKFDSSNTVAAALQVRADGSGCGFDVGEVRVFRFCDRGWDCDYDEVCVPDRFRVVCEGDVWVVIRLEEFPDLACVHVEADRLQVAWRHASASGSPT